MVNVHDKLFLVDCGEGTQVQLRKYRVKFQRIDHIFISHMHGDHFLGLIGLISSMHLLGRKRDLHVYGPPAIKEVILVQLRASQTNLTFYVHFHETKPDGMNLLVEDNTLTVHSFPLKHRIDCTGFLFKEKTRDYSIRKSSIKENQLQISEILQLKKGIDIERETGEVLKVEELTDPPPTPKSYAFCSDTAYTEDTLQYIQAVSTLYYESTFLNILIDRAVKTFHSTAKQAGEMARLAEVKQLIIGHFSSRYTDETSLLEEAKSSFPNTVLAEEGLTIDV